MGIRGGAGESPRSAHEQRLVVGSHKDGDLRTVRAVGELDLATAPLLEERLRQTFEHHAGPTVLDLTEVILIGCEP